MLLIDQQQTYAISGKVTDENNHPIPEATVMLKELQKGVATDASGQFQIASLPSGTYTLIISYVGRQSVQQKITLHHANYITSIVLYRKNETLNEITIAGSQNKFSTKRTDYVARLPLKNLENPQVYSVIGKDLMNEQLATDVLSAIQNAPGINSVTESVGSGGVGLNVNLRGFSADIALRNGMATNYVTLTDPINLERLEVIKGPSATLFGSTLTSYGGLINRVTKQPFDTFQGNIGYSFGSNNLSRLTADINTPLNTSKTLLFRVTAAKHNEDSFQDYGYQRNYAITPNLVYHASDKLTLQVETELYHTERPSNFFGISGGVTAKDFNGLRYQFDHSYGSDDLQSAADVFNVFARATYKISEQWTSQTNFSSGNTDNNANYLFLTFLDNSNVRRMPMQITSKFTSQQIQQNFIGNFQTGTLRHKLLIGLDYYHLQTNDRRTRFVLDTVSNSSPDVDINIDAYHTRLGQTAPFTKYQRNTSTYSAYASDVVNLTEALNIMASLRVDYFDNKAEDYTQTAFSPKLGATYEVLKDQLSVFGNYMDGFRNIAPDVSDPANPIDYEPEHATQWEGGIKTDLFQKHVNFTLSYYDITVRNIVRTVPNNDNIGGFNSVQDGTKQSKGLEAELIANPLRGWNIVAGYGYNDSKYTKASEDVQGNRPYSTPKNSINFWTSYKLQTGVLHGLGLGFGGNSVSDAFLDDANTFTIPAYTILHTTIFYEQPSYRVGVKINNLTDEHYWTASYWATPQKTRNVVLNFTYKF
ncbi:TonB-dependent siderophore receptor [Zhouia sp. PK063]|uniref:TonB-dependent siderophore receptor n=1 Tax=Zhouia sp. PK063 TaxID=3373602 RepID=UPI0037AF9892